MGLKYLPIHGTYDEFLADAAAARSECVRSSSRASSATSRRSRAATIPHADIRVGDAFLAETFHSGGVEPPNWSSTVFVRHL